MRFRCGHGAAVVFLWVGVPALLAQASSTPSAETQQHIERVEAGLVLPVIVKGEPHTTHTLKERMAELDVPGVSIAVIRRM